MSPGERERMHTQWGVATDAGGRRSVNEDSVLALPPVFVVADGMGGHARGDMASRTVVAAMEELAAADAPLGPDDVQHAVERAAHRIRETMAAESERSVAGSTIAGVVLTEQGGEPSWLVLNVGDSRVYRSTRAGLAQVSVDHSLVQELVEAGTIDAEQARRHPQRNVITRAVGTGAVPEVDFWMLRAVAGERLLVCSDGLVGELSDAEIAETLRDCADPAAAAEVLVRRATAGGGANDNVTALVVEVTAGGDEDSTEPASPGA